MAEETEGVTTGITDEELALLLPALAEAERANSETTARFVPPRPGILEEVSARRHQLVYGRRGVGKSTLLQRVAAGGLGVDRAVIFVDIETLRGRPYPDVLIELITMLLDHLEARLREDGRIKAWKRRKVRKRVRELSDVMGTLLQEPQQAQHTLSVLRSQGRHINGGSSFRFGGRLGAKWRYADAEVGAQAQRITGAEQSEAREDTVAATFERTKMDGLVEAATLIRDVLDEAHNELGVPTLVVLDDYYHIALDDQAEVLGYLHQVVKGLDISLKVCGVKRLMKPFAAGNPPLGMEPPHDAGIVPLDITLERFEGARGFLERVLAGICEPLRIDLDRLLTDGGRERLVLASGGVARDYLTLTRGALRNAAERPSHATRPKNRITAEDVAAAATDQYSLKQDELKRDAREGAEQLRSHLADIVRFCVETNRTNVFLVEATRLEEEEWGRDVQALADLRFIHRVDTLSVKRGGETYAGRKFAAFTLDLATWTSTRSEQIGPVNFWEREGRQKLREPKLIYTPERAQSAAGDGAKAPAADLAPLAEDEQLSFDDLEELSA